MRLWSIHPKYLDRAWLLACWREWLLAKKVLEWNTKWYKNHPQLIRFKQLREPLVWINAFLSQIYLESVRRWYKFNSDKICLVSDINIIKVTEWQVQFEVKHLSNKLLIRDYERYLILSKNNKIDINSIFELIPWDIELWEKI